MNCALEKNFNELKEIKTNRNTNVFHLCLFLCVGACIKTRLSMSPSAVHISNRPPIPLLHCPSSLPAKSTNGTGRTCVRHFLRHYISSLQVELPIRKNTTGSKLTSSTRKSHVSICTQFLMWFVSRYACLFDYLIRLLNFSVCVLLRGKCEKAEMVRVFQCRHLKLRPTD